MKLSKKGEARHSQQHPFQSLLPFPVAGEGHHCSNRSRSSAVAPAEVLPDMSYYISDTMSISCDPCVPLRPGFRGALLITSNEYNTANQLVATRTYVLNENSTPSFREGGVFAILLPS